MWLERRRTLQTGVKHDYLTSCVYRELRQLDRAEAFAVSSVRTWDVEGVSRRDSAEADIAMAKLHAIAGELDTIPLARKAVAGVAELRSVRARLSLIPLAQALETRPRGISGSSLSMPGG